MLDEAYKELKTKEGENVCRLLEARDKAYQGFTYYGDKGWPNKGADLLI